MGRYWLKIGLSACLIFLVGFGILSGARHMRSSIHSDKDLTIPLGAFGAYLPFKFDGAKIGSLRSLVIQRSAPKEITGFSIRARVNDSAALERFRDCRVSVTDATNFDERTTFFCLKSDSGFRTFGEVRVELRGPDGTHTIIQPLMLTESAIREFQHHNADSVVSADSDSLAAELSGRVKAQARLLSDSIRAATLEGRAKQMQRQADSIRARAPSATVPPARKP